MKNKMLLVLFSILMTNALRAQKTVEEWKGIISVYRSQVDILLDKERPRNLDITSFKKALGKGDLVISETTKQQIEQNAIPLIEYGKELATKNNLDITDKDELLFISCFAPNTDLNATYTVDLSKYTQTLNGPAYQFEKVTDLTGSEIFECALTAIGVDAAYAFSSSSGTSWSISALRRTFTNVAKRFLGPIGVALAVGSFGYCLYEAY
jgi:hypothetical protein